MTPMHNYGNHYTYKITTFFCNLNVFPHDVAQVWVTKFPSFSRTWAHLSVNLVIAWTQVYRREELEAEVGLRLWDGLKVNNKYDTVYKTIQRWVLDVTLHVVLKAPHVCFERQHTRVGQRGGAEEVQPREQLHVSNPSRV